MTLRSEGARRRAKQMFYKGVAGAYATYTGGKFVKDVVDTASNVKDLYDFYTTDKSTAEWGAGKLKDDTYGIVNLPVKSRKKNIAVKYSKMPKKGKSTKRGFVITSSKPVIARSAKSVPVKIVSVQTAKSGKSYSKSKPTLKKQVKDLKRQVRADQAYHTNRRRQTGSVSCTTNQSTYSTISPATNVSVLESSMANLRYYNPSVPGTLTTADASTGTYSRQIHIASIYKKLLVRNNYQVPCKVTLMSFVPKTDTDNSPVTFYSNGITDQTISGSVNQSLSYITDIDMVNDNWRIASSKTKLLQPSQELTLTHKTKAFNYDPSNVDTHNLVYQKKYGGQIFVVRIEGALAHDTIADEQTTTQASIDYVCDMTLKFIYDAGGNLNDYSYANGADASFTNSGVLSNKAVSDNQAYSVT